jgi:hypothetical protein
MLYTLSVSVSALSSRENRSALCLITVGWSFIFQTVRGHGEGRDMGRIGPNCLSPHKGLIYQDQRSFPNSEVYWAIWLYLWYLLIIFTKLKLIDSSSYTKGIQPHKVKE